MARMPELSHGRRMLVLAICCMSLLIVSLDNTVLNVALPSLQRELDASTSGLQWTIDAYTLVLASLLMLAGSTADRIGRRRVFPGRGGPRRGPRGGRRLLLVRRHLRHGVPPRLVDPDRVRRGGPDAGRPDHGPAGPGHGGTRGAAPEVGGAAASAHGGGCLMVPAPGAGSPWLVAQFPAPLKGASA